MSHEARRDSIPHRTGPLLRVICRPCWPNPSYGSVFLLQNCDASHIAINVRRRFLSRSEAELDDTWGSDEAAQAPLIWVGDHQSFRPIRVARRLYDRVLHIAAMNRLPHTPPSFLTSNRHAVVYSKSTSKSELVNIGDGRSHVTMAVTEKGAQSHVSSVAR